MASNSIFLLLFSLLSLLHLHSSAAQSSVKAVYWFPDNEFPASNIDSTLFTHLFCAFADVDPTTYQVTVASQNTNAFSTFTTTVQQKNPSVKTLLSIGGGGSADIKNHFSSMASQPNSRKTFIDSAINLARSYNFHGLDLDWEYPATDTDMTNLGVLLKEWRDAVVAESSNSGKATLLLTAAFYYAPKIDQYNGNYGVVAWIQAGLPPKKLVLGFPFYGYAWRLVNADNHGLFAPTNGEGTGSDGVMLYKQIKQFMAQNGAATVFNASIVGGYCYAGTTWIGYDDTQSISTKVSYAKGKGLLGYFAWHVAADDNWVLSQLG
ncbi:unnamed protein product, partial [Vitis vinifera]